MKLNQKGFGVIEGLLAVIAITLIVGTGFYVVNARKDKDDTATQTSQKTEQKSSDRPVAETKQPQKSDKDLIIQAVKDYRGSGLNEGDVKSVEVKDIVGNNARGSFFLDPTGAAYIAHKSDGKWEVVFVGQGEVSKDVGTKYNLPADWYSTDY